MNYQPSQNDIVNEYIENLSAEIAPLFLEIRACILEAGPEFNESIKWKNCLVYGTTKNHIQTVVGKGKISLIFHDGVAIEDAYGLLEGDGKKARTVRITSPDFNRAALQDYVRQILQRS
ncbi:DUF1801 domain-containing protein [Candidatus Leptofilum sp.]|uniref:DUF1801 domain-containing protein n=1 Tax=Candidatus Leptofilum sp. TaxID=3241576 RepID=UPI003B5C2E66